MTSPSAEAAANQADKLKSILCNLNPTEIEVDSLGRIIVRSAELREALRVAAAEMRTDEVTGGAPTNGHQCICHNISQCLPLV